MARRESQAQLSVCIAEASGRVVIGAKYSRYKSKEDDVYVLLDVALWEATNEPCVIY
jgi:hypothetical protein